MSTTATTGITTTTTTTTTTKDGLRRHYDAIASIYVSDYQVQVPGKEHVDVFLAMMMPSAGRQLRVLDCGCGGGDQANFMHSKGMDVTALDASPEMRRLAETRFPGLTVVDGDMAKLPFDDACFDGVFCSFALFHVMADETDATLAGFYRVLRPGGVLYLAVQESSQDMVVAAAPEPCDPTRSVWLQTFSRGALEAKVSQVGFEIERSTLEPPTPGQHPYGKLRIWARRPHHPPSA